MLQIFQKCRYRSHTDFSHRKEQISLGQHGNPGVGAVVCVKSPQRKINSSSVSEEGRKGKIISQRNPESCGRREFVLPCPCPMCVLHLLDLKFVWYLLNSCYCLWWERGWPEIERNKKKKKKQRNGKCWRNSDGCWDEVPLKGRFAASFFFVIVFWLLVHIWLLLGLLQWESVEKEAEAGWQVKILGVSSPGGEKRSSRAAHLSEPVPSSVICVCVCARWLCAEGVPLPVCFCVDEWVRWKSRSFSPATSTTCRRSVPFQRSTFPKVKQSSRMPLANSVDPWREKVPHSIVGTEVRPAPVGHHSPSSTLLQLCLPPNLPEPSFSCLLSQPTTQPKTLFLWSLWASWLFVLLPY